MKSRYLVPAGQLQRGKAIFSFKLSCHSLFTSQLMHPLSLPFHLLCYIPLLRYRHLVHSVNPYLSISHIPLFLSSPRPPFLHPPDSSVAEHVMLSKSKSISPSILQQSEKGEKTACVGKHDKFSPRLFSLSVLTHLNLGIRTFAHIMTPASIVRSSITTW